MSEKNELFYHIKRFRAKASVIGLICFTIAGLSFFAVGLYFSRSATSKNDIDYCTVLNSRMKRSIDTFLDSMNSSGKILYSNTEFINYDGTPESDPYDENIEGRLRTFLNNVSVIDNYADYGTVYSNNKTLGRVSDSCRDLFNDDIYGALSDALGDEASGWFTGFYDDDNEKKDFKKLYYARRINPKAIFFSSCYSTDLESKFTQGFKSETIRSVLVDNKGMIIFDTDEANLSRRLDSDIRDLLAEKKDATIKTSFRLIASLSFENGWQIITIMDMDSRRQLSIKFGIIGAFSIALIILLFELLLKIAAARYDPEKSMLDRSKSIDPISHLHNADYTENVILDKIETSITGSTFVLMIINITNLDLIEQSYDEETRNEAIANVAQAIDDLFGSEHIVGIMRNDEFAVFADFTDLNLFKAYDDIRASVSGLAKRLERCELGSDKGEIKTAVGAVLYPDCSADYDELLELGETAAKECAEDKNRNYVLYKKKGDVRNEEDKK